MNPNPSPRAADRDLGDDRSSRADIGAEVGSYHSGALAYWDTPLRVRFGWDQTIYHDAGGLEAESRPRTLAGPDRADCLSVLGLGHRDDILVYDIDFLSGDVLDVRSPERKEVDDATTPEAVAAVLERCDLRSAKRILYLERLHRDDPDEPKIDLESLKRLVLVMLDHPQWGEPALTLRDGGYVHAEWRTENDGSVGISFLPGGRAAYSALSAPADTPDFLNIGGVHLEAEAISNLRWFTDRIVT